MTPEHTEHMHHIIKQVIAHISTKYPKGVEKYNSKLWEYGALKLLDASIEEKIDDIVYSLTQRDVMIAMIEQMQHLRDENDYLRMLNAEAAEL